VAKAKLMSGYRTHFHAPSVRTYININKISFIVFAILLGSSASKNNLIIQSSVIIKGKDRLRNEDVLLRVNEQRNILHEIRKRKADWIGHVLRRNCNSTTGY